MHHTTTTIRHYPLIAPPSSASTATAYAMANAVGLVVRHLDTTKCFTFEDLEGRGAFKNIGWLVRSKSRQQWRASARGDATALDVSTLIELGLLYANGYGRRPPRDGFRDRSWECVTQPSGDRVARAGVCREIVADDAGAGLEAAAPLDWDIALQAIVGAPS